MPPQPSPLQSGLAAAEAGDYARADAIARGLLARNPADVHGLQIAGYAAFRQGRNEEALRAFLSAHRAAPGQPALLYWLGVLFKERGDFEQAERAFRDALRVNPRYGEAWCHLGETLYLRDRKEEARQAYEAAIAAEPSSAAVLARAAKHFEITHDLARARTLSEEAVRLYPEDEIGKIALVEIDLREGRNDDVIARAAPILASGVSNPRSRSRLSHLVATAHDRKGEHDKAFTAYVEANHLQRDLDLDRARLTPSPLQTENLDRLIAFLRTSEIGAWPRHIHLEGAAPVFLLGFVRSGTTWLDQILSSHPGVSVMEEEDNFIDAWRDLLISDAGLRRLAALSREEANFYRDRYWARARKILKAADDHLIVDKLPLNTVNLPLIWRLFPEAKIIFALRDPRDAVFSAFQQYFQINTGMSHFLDITAAAGFYDRVMTIGLIVRESAAIAVHEVRYENVVADLESEARRLIAFLGLDWNPSILNYHETARKRAIRTPSARQVIERPYATSIGKWRRYREGMAPALPILAPWVATLGYDPD